MLRQLLADKEAGKHRGARARASAFLANFPPMGEQPVQRG